MRPVRCNLCGADDTRLLFVGHDRLHKLPGHFNIVQCRRCKLIYQNPQLEPEEVLAYYPQNYHSYFLPIDQESSWFRRIDRQRGIDRRCAVVQQRARQPGRLLDVGCGTGIFIDAMRKRGWEVYGSDLNPAVAQYTSPQSEVSITIGELTEIGYPANFFDVVTLWDVIEHVHNPYQTLIEIMRILKPGGLVVVNTPNPVGIDARVFGKTWAGWDVPRHLYLLSPAVLQCYLEKVGLRYCEILSFTPRHGGLLLNLHFTLEEYISSLAVRKILLAIARSLPTRLATWPIHWIMERFNQSLCYTMFARAEKGCRE